MRPQGLACGTQHVLEPYKRQHHDARRLQVRALLLHPQVIHNAYHCCPRVRLGKRIAEGGFSFVYLAWSGDSKFALKKIICQGTEQLEAVQREIEVHNTLSHPSLLKLIGHGQQRVSTL